ncbi:hypothetical protein BD324DRAFT_647855 [Kockovaella imperatae]|uniref:Uncharacterized protein n=1 Tax=Kockovaella imperatae TaxID=4999 RepID=A0A1Y1USM0_9TREE|nr:hypothetical protein BD324DRAFT_647855 [Kockovaella imperatae]ORX40952.1 hypothetical protein BD324DRAFT_647855 [Kockovaella imperatae]
MSSKDQTDPQLTHRSVDEDVKSDYRGLAPTEGNENEIPLDGLTEILNNMTSMSEEELDRGSRLLDERATESLTSSIDQLQELNDKLGTEDYDSDESPTYEEKFAAYFDALTETVPHLNEEVKRKIASEFSLLDFKARLVSKRGTSDLGGTNVDGLSSKVMQSMIQNTIGADTPETEQSRTGDSSKQLGL